MKPKTFSLLSSAAPHLSPFGSAPAAQGPDAGASGLVAGAPNLCSLSTRGVGLWGWGRKAFVLWHTLRVWFAARTGGRCAPYPENKVFLIFVSLRLTSVMP